MRTVISHTFVTLDGVAAPDAVMDTIVALRNTEEVLDDFFGKVAQEDAMLLGRVTYEEWADHWPTSDFEPFASHINSVPKYVVSRTLEQVAWNNSRLVKGDVLSELRSLRAQAGQTLQTWGSTELLQALLENDLIDEYRLFIFPVVLGSGKRLFGSGTVPMALTPMASVTSDKGATYLRLAEYGQIDR